MLQYRDPIRRKQACGRVKNPKTVRLYRQVISTHEYVSVRLPECRAKFEGMKFGDIVTAINLYDKKDPGITQVILQKLCEDYLKIYSPEDQY